MTTGDPPRLVEAQPQEHIAPKALHDSRCFTGAIQVKAHLRLCAARSPPTPAAIPRKELWFPKLQSKIRKIEVERYTAANDPRRTVMPPPGALPTWEKAAAAVAQTLAEFTTSSAPAR